MQEYNEVKQVKEVKQEDPATTASTHKGIFQASYLVYYVLGLLETALALRLIFKLLGANPDSGQCSIKGVPSWQRLNFDKYCLFLKSSFNI